MKTLAAFLLLFSIHASADLTQERLDAVPDIYKTLELESLEYTPSDIEASVSWIGNL